MSAWIISIMSIIATGTEIVETVRIAKMIETHGEQFLERVYTADEIEYCVQTADAPGHFATRWAAKEAVLKAMGTGWAFGIKWTEVEVFNQPGGKPIMNITGKAKEICEERGIADILISISHCKAYAVAYAVAIGE